MRIVALGLTLAAAAAAAFTATYVVVTDDAVIYDQAHQYDDDYVVARPPYWTPATCETVGTPQSPRTYCLVTLEDGRRGLAEWDYFGRLLVVRDGATLATGPGGDKAAATVAAGEEVARVGEETTPQGELWLELVTRDGRRGWLPAAAVTAAGD